MMVIGAQYNNECKSRDLAICNMETSCNVEFVPQFLKISSGIMMGFNLLHLFFRMCCMLITDDRVKNGKVLCYFAVTG